VEGPCWDGSRERRVGGLALSMSERVSERVSGMRGENRRSTSSRYLEPVRDDWVKDPALCCLELGSDDIDHHHFVIGLSQRMEGRRWARSWTNEVSSVPSAYL
jgi:hypothetical protein